MTDAKDVTFEPRLSLARYAEALAYIRDYPASEHVRVLSRLGVDAADFERACVVWPDVLLRELAQRDPTRLLAFAEAYAAAEHFARTVHPPVERIESRAVEPVAARAGIRARAMRKLPSRAAASVSGAVGPAKVQASYMKAEARDLGAPPPAAGSVPATAVAGPPQPLLGPPPPAPIAPIDVDATGMVDPRLLAEPILPFQGRSTPVTPVVSPAKQNDAPPTSWKPSSSSRGAEGSTEELDLRAMLRAVSPFAPDGAAAKASGPSTADTDETGMFMAAPDLAAAKSEPTSEPEPAPMTLDRYASVSAELADGEPSEVLRRLGLERETWVRAMSDMAARFKAEPGLEERYRDLMRAKLGHARAGKAGR